MNMTEIMTKIQAELKAPKGQYNDFGNYKYRSCEDIVEAVKPLLSEHGAFLNISDEIVLIGDRYYVKATASVNAEEHTIKSSGFARESLEKRGMDASQITGSASSYARKYALNGLFAIDDTKDADTNEAKTQADSSRTPRINKKQMQSAVQAILSALDDDDDLGLKEVLGELEKHEQEFIWSQFDTEQKSKIKSMLHQAKNEVAPNP